TSAVARRGLSVALLRLADGRQMSTRRCHVFASTGGVNADDSRRPSGVDAYRRRTGVAVQPQPGLLSERGTGARIAGARDPALDGTIVASTRRECADRARLRGE